jgi:hypothetical protein
MQMHGGPGLAQRRDACSQMPLRHALTGIPSPAEIVSSARTGPAGPPRRRGTARRSTGFSAHAGYIIPLAARMALGKRRKEGT